MVPDAAMAVHLDVAAVLAVAMAAPAVVTAAVVLGAAAAVEALMTYPARNAPAELDPSMRGLMLQTIFPPDSAWSIAPTGCLLESFATNRLDGALGISNMIQSLMLVISRGLSNISGNIPTVGSTTVALGD